MQIDYSKFNGSRTAKLYEYKGEMVTVAHLSYVSGLAKATINARLRDGQTAEQAIAKRKRGRPCPPKTYRYRDQDITVAQISEMCGLSPGHIRRKLNNGCSVKDILNVSKLSATRSSSGGQQRKKDGPLSCHDVNKMLNESRKRVEDAESDMVFATVVFGGHNTCTR